MIKLACPCCFKELDTNLQCTCGFFGTIENGVYHLHRSDVSWVSCLQQNIASKKAANGTLPIAGSCCSERDVERSKVVHEKLQNVFIDHCPRKVGVFLELGAVDLGNANYLLTKGWSGFLLNIEEENLPQSTSVLTSVVGDGYFLPFSDCQFDLVFDRSSLHHFERLSDVLFQVHRVLKPRGVYLSVGNPACLEKDIEAAKGRKEMYMKEYGLIETMPTKAEYEKNFMSVFGNFQWCPILDNSLMRSERRG